MLQKEMFDVVVYHNECFDGTAAKVVVEAHHSENGYTKPVFIPMDNGPDQQILAGELRAIVANMAAQRSQPTKILFVDVCPDRNFIAKLDNMRAAVTVVDHHRTAYRTCLSCVTDLAEDEVSDYMLDEAKVVIGTNTGRVRWFLDKEVSGALLAWTLFMGPAAATPVIKHVSDRDLWQFKVRGTRAVMAGLGTYAMESAEFADAVMDTSESSRDALALPGAFILNMLSQQVDRVIGAGVLHVPFRDRHGGITLAPAANCPYFMASDVCHKLLKLYPIAPFSATFSITPASDGNDYMCTVRVSMRSEDNRYDVEAIARRYGGGGHRNAAGFEYDVPSEGVYTLMFDESDI